LPRRASASGSCQTTGSLGAPRGVARRKAQTYGVRVLARRGGRLPARHMRSKKRAHAHLRTSYRRQAALSVAGRLSTGTPIGPERSPDAARVPGLREPGPQAPHPVPPQRTPRDDALRRTRCAESNRAPGRGDKLATNFPSPLLPSPKRSHVPATLASVSGAHQAVAAAASSRRSRVATVDLSARPSMRAVRKWR